MQSNAELNSHLKIKYMISRHENSQTFHGGMGQSAKSSFSWGYNFGSSLLEYWPSDVKSESTVGIWCVNVCVCTLKKFCLWRFYKKFFRCKKERIWKNIIIKKIWNLSRVLYTRTRTKQPSLLLNSRLSRIKI